MVWPHAIPRKKINSTLKMSISINYYFSHFSRNSWTKHLDLEWHAIIYFFFLLLLSNIVLRLPTIHFSCWLVLPSKFSYSIKKWIKIMTKRIARCFSSILFLLFPPFPLCSPHYCIFYINFFRNRCTISTVR